MFSLEIVKQVKYIFFSFNHVSASSRPTTELTNGRDVRIVKVETFTLTHNFLNSPIITY